MSLVLKCVRPFHSKPFRRSASERTSSVCHHCKPRYSVMDRLSVTKYRAEYATSLGHTVTFWSQWCSAILATSFRAIVAGSGGAGGGAGAEGELVNSVGLLVLTLLVLLLQPLRFTIPVSMTR